jgi:hypothetical protein
MTMVVFCGNNVNIAVGSHLEMLNPNGSTAVFRYKAVSVGSSVNGQYTVMLLNEGGAPDGGPIQTGNKEWIVVGSDWRDSCDSLREVDYASHFVVQTPPDPNDCCNPGCGCYGRLPIQPGPVVFVPNPDLPGTFIPVSGSGAIDLDFGGNISIAQNLTVAGNMCNPFAVSQPQDPSAQAVGVNASGCLRRIPVQRFVPENKFLFAQQFQPNPPTNGTITITPVPAGATHALIEATVYHRSGSSVSNVGIGMQIAPNDTTPFSVDNLVVWLTESAEDDSSEYNTSTICLPLINTTPQFKFQTVFTLPPVFTAVSYNVQRGYAFYLRGFYVTT